MSWDHLMPIPAKKATVEHSGTVVGAGRYGRVVGGGVRVIVEGCANDTTTKDVQARIQQVIEAHLDEIVELSA